MNCLKCNEKLIKDSMYTCYKCKRGLHYECGEIIRQEINKLFCETKCEYCHHDIDNYCKECLDHIDEIVERYKQMPRFKNVLVNRQFADKEVGIGPCRCDDRCKCDENCTRIIKNEKYNVNIAFRETFDENITYLALVICDDCNDNKINDIFL